MDKGNCKCWVDVYVDHQRSSKTQLTEKGGIGMSKAPCALKHIHVVQIYVNYVEYVRGRNDHPCEKS